MTLISPAHARARARTPAPAPAPAPTPAPTPTRTDLPLVGSSLVYTTIFVLDSAAFALAIVAEQRHNTASIRSNPQEIYEYCVYDPDISTGLGIGAFSFLLVSQILVMFVTRCLCFGRPLQNSGARTWAKILFFMQWTAFIIAGVCLLGGSVRNAYHTRYRAIFKSEPLSCDTVRRGIFGAGAAFTLFTCILTILYHYSYAIASHAVGDTYKD